MKKLRVLFLTNLPAPYRIDFFNELGKFCDLTVLFERQSAGNRNSHWFSGVTKNFKSVFLRGITMDQDSAFCPHVISFLCKGRFDLYVIGGYSTPTAMLASIWLKLWRIPYILNVDGGFIKKDSLLVFAIKQFFIGSAAWWLSTGNYTNRYLDHYGNKKQKAFIYPFTSVKSLEMFSSIASISEKTSLRQELGICGDNVILSVGQFINRKGFDVLIKAWNYIPQNTSLLIIGGGPEKEKLISVMPKEGKGFVHLIDFKSKEDLKKYYRAADLFVLPTREDIWGLVVNEAMACGLPVISTDKCVAALELEENGYNGYIVPADNEYALADKINYLLSDKDLLSNMSQKSLERINFYTIENMAKVHYDVFLSIFDRQKLI